MRGQRQRLLKPLAYGSIALQAGWKWIRTSCAGIDKVTITNTSNITEIFQLGEIKHDSAFKFNITKYIGNIDAPKIKFQILQQSHNTEGYVPYPQLVIRQK
jgi:hypothetical protein